MVKSKRTSKKTKEQEASEISALPPVQETHEVEKPIPTVNVLQIIGSLVGLTGIIAALFWFLGYVYYAGVYASVDYLFISSNLSNEDYINAGTFSFITLFINSLLVIVVLIGSAKLVEFVNKKLQMQQKFAKVQELLFLVSSWSLIFLGIKYVFASKVFYTQGLFSVFEGLPFFVLGVGGELMVTSSPKEGKTTFIFSRIFYLSIITPVLIQTHIFISFRNGYQYGCNKILNKNNQVVLYMNSPSSSTGVTKVDGYYLIFFDKNFYYLYQDINQETLKPKVLTVIDKSKVAMLEDQGNTQNTSILTTNNKICLAKALEDTKRKINQ